MSVSDHQEVERKFEVDAHSVFPNLTAATGAHRVDQPEVYDLEAVYVDTAQPDLASHGVTLRRRTGGTDEGWHLTLPAG